MFRVRSIPFPSSADDGVHSLSRTRRPVYPKRGRSLRPASRPELVGLGDAGSALSRGTRQCASSSRRYSEPSVRLNAGVEVLPGSRRTDAGRPAE